MTVLLVGFDPSTVPGVDAELVNSAIAIGQAKFDEHGIDTRECLVAPDDTAEATITHHLTDGRYDCVVVGGGIRKPEELLEFFELVVNLIHRHAPEAAIAFNTNPTDSAEAALRWIVR